MKPKTKEHKRVLNFAATRIQGTDQKSLLKTAKNLYPAAYSTYNRKQVCLECGHVIGKEEQEVCPNCHAIFIKSYSKDAFSNFPYISLPDYLMEYRVVEEYQVLLYYRTDMLYHRTHPAELSVEPVFQLWINTKNNKITNYGRIHKSSYYYDRFYDNMQIRNLTNQYNFRDVTIHGKCHIHPVYKMKGVTRKMLSYNIHPLDLFQKLNDYTFYETLLKSSLYEWALYEYTNSELTIALKICLRNNYKIKDRQLYKDYIRMLVNEHKDIHNAFYSCPKDLHTAHQEALARIRRAQEKERKRKRKEKINKILSTIDDYNPEYINRISKFNSLLISDDQIVVRPLEDIYEVMKEGEELNHCVFISEYHLHKDSLLLSARIEDKRIETVEINLREYRINQVHGYDNKDSEYHDKIIELMESNMSLIKKLHKKRNKKQNLQGV